MASLATLEHVLDVYGSDRSRWPAELRAELATLIEDSAEARARLEEGEALDQLLARAPAPAPASADLAAQIVAGLPVQGRVIPLPMRRLLSLGAPLAAAAALALWLLGPGAPAGTGPHGTSAPRRLAETDHVATDQALLALAESDAFSWEVPGDAFLEVAHLDPLEDVPEWGCTTGELGCLDITDSWGNGEERRSDASQRKWT